MPSSTLVFRITLLSFSTLWFSSAFAAGFSNDAQSVSTMGNAAAGAGAAGDDASIMYYNPAGLTLLDEGQVVLSGIYAIPHTELTVDEAKDSFGNPTPGSEGKEYMATPAQLSPGFYAAAPIGERFVVGMSVNSPYNLWTEYDTSSDVSNTARQTQFYTYTGNLSLAMEVAEGLSLGVGANVQYFKAKMNAAPQGTITQGDAMLKLDGFTEYTGDDIGFYPTLGLLYEFTKDTRAGLSYRAPVNHNTQGDLTNDIGISFFTPGQEPQVVDLPINSAASSEFKLPDIVSLSFFHQFNHNIELLADVAFTHWGRMQNVSVTTLETIFTTNEPINSEVAFQNTWRFGLGANYIYTPELKFRVGAAYDESPVTDEHRTLQGPDSDRVDVAVGASYRPRAWEDTYIDLAYMHTFFEGGTVTQSNPLALVIPPNQLFPDLNTNTVSGSFSTYANYLGIQLVHLM